jgi:predicted amidohydrolase
MSWAIDEKVDVLCLPECFLTGYFRTRDRAAENSIALESMLFESILADLRAFESTLILGLIERTASGLFNSAAVVERGQLLGVYRKRHLVESVFEHGYEIPVFERQGVKFGVNICYDANFPDGARALAEHGARVIFYPLNNSLPLTTGRRWRHRHIQNLINRARECSVWVVSADVTERTPSRIGYGCTAIVDPSGSIVRRCPELEVGRLSGHI